MKVCVSRVLRLKIFYKFILLSVSPITYFHCALDLKAEAEKI